MTRPAAPPLVSLEPEDRAWLHARITDRFDHMLGAGFVDEVRRLRARGPQATLPSMRCVGYRQACELLDAAGGGPLDAAAQAALRERGIAATRQFAKRQLTWLRSMPQRIPCDRPGAVDAVVAEVRRLLVALDRGVAHA